RVRPARRRTTNGPRARSRRRWHLRYSARADLLAYDVAAGLGTRPGATSARPRVAAGQETHRRLPRRSFAPSRYSPRIHKERVMKSLVLGLAVLASAGAVQAMPPAAAPAAYIPAPPPPTGLVTIYDNIARKYPKGLYNEVAGRAITGTSNPIGFPQVWIATAFTPATSHALK